MNKSLILLFFIFVGCFIFIRSQQKKVDVVPAPSPIPVPSPIPIVPNNISVVIPKYLSYQEIIAQLNLWNKEASNLTEIGIYGQTNESTDIYYIRITNKNNTDVKPKILITGCIHGNEPHSTAVIMAYIGSLLSEYAKNEKITELINNRDIYFVPVVSPDSYPHSRHVDGVDPNRDFINVRSGPIREIQQFAKKHNFNAVWSGHTYGRVFLIPWGDNMKPCPDDAIYREIMQEIAKMCNYNMIRACEMYGYYAGKEIRFGDIGWKKEYTTPIYGGELDWFYREDGFAIVCEYGTHQHKPSYNEIKSEFERTFKGFLYFIEFAPITKLNPTR